MCTVTFIPVRGKVVITSNRDEKFSRLPANPPAFCLVQGKLLVCPVDGDKGGTWIALKENGDAAVLLNGAFQKHIPAGSYRKSRGLILPEVLAQERPVLYFSRLSLDAIEPFTLVLYEHHSLYELRWDGRQKYCRQLPAHRPCIWSSATLYDAATTRKREHWFASFLNCCPVPTQLDILRFHEMAGEGDPQIDLRMNRAEGYHTVSTTSILLCEGRGSMTYRDYSRALAVEKKIELTDNMLAA